MIYVANGTEHQVELVPMDTAVRRAFGMKARRAGVRPTAAAAGIERAAASLTLAVTRSIARTETLAQRFSAEQPSRVMVVTRPDEKVPSSALTIATESVAVEGARRADLDFAAQRFGASVAQEGAQGKVLLRLPGNGRKPVERAFELARKLLERGVAIAHPNFIRAIPRVAPSTGALKPLWNHAITGVAKAWKTTRGRKDVRVAVLDEGVDGKHPALRAAVVAQRDFIGQNGDDARPHADDAHGTACAGIVLSRHGEIPGIAPRCMLIAARIAEDDGFGNWIIDDFGTADAIDWCWERGGDVLNNSWGGGPPVDVITRAFERARTLGRNGKGAVVVAAAGNSQGLVEFPATLPGVLAVGASNQFDERKTRTSRDGERSWGSNYGKELALLAPGVAIATTDIRGAAGYDPGDYTTTFNGTSSATPHVAAAAALILGVAPHLRASQVRQILTSTARKLKGQTVWTKQLGHGRLDVAAAVAAAKAAPASPTVVATAAKSARRRKPARPRNVLRRAARIGARRPRGGSPASTR